MYRSYYEWASLDCFIVLFRNILISFVGFFKKNQTVLGQGREMTKWSITSLFQSTVSLHGKVDLIVFISP